MFSSREAEKWWRRVRSACQLFKYNLNAFLFFPVGLKEVLCCALRTLATGPELGVLDCYNYCGMNKLGGSGGTLPQENFLN